MDFLGKEVSQVLFMYLKGQNSWFRGPGKQAGRNLAPRTKLRLRRLLPAQ